MILFFAEITPEKLQSFADRVFHQVKIQSLVHGSVDKKTAFHLNDLLLNNLKPQPFTEFTLGKIVQLPPPGLFFCFFFFFLFCFFNYSTLEIQCTVYEEEQMDPEAINSAIYYYFQLGSRNIELDCLTDLYGHIVSEHAFDELRTKQQLGVRGFSSFFFVVLFEF